MTEATKDTPVTEPESNENEMGMKQIPLSLIVEPGFRLREPQRDLPEYQELLASIKRMGVRQSCEVRPITRDGVQKYELIDGTQRFNASMDAGKTHLPCTIRKMDDQEAKEVQIVNNIVRVQQKHAQVGNMLKDMLNNDFTLTVPELARRISKSPSYVQERLLLTKLKPEFQQLVNDQKMPLVNAIMLAKFDEEHQAEFLDAAMKDPAEKFIPEAQARKKEIDKAKREARAEHPPQFTPIAKVQKKDLLLQEREAIAAGNSSLILSYLGTCGVEVTPKAKEFACHILDWVLRIDKKTLAAEESKWKEEQKLKVEKAKALAQERQKVKAEKEKNAAKVKV